MKKHYKIILLGYMASGKSTVGKSLAKALNISFIDLDDYIVAAEKTTISEIFSTKGEAYFRDLELVYLKEVLNKNESFVLALGGGTPTINGALKLINKHISIYLKAKVKTLYKRLIPNEIERPLLMDVDHQLLKDHIKMQIKERKPFYKKAKYKIKTDGLSLEEIIDLIRRKTEVGSGKRM